MVKNPPFKGMSVYCALKLLQEIFTGCREHAKVRGFHERTFP